MLVLAIIALIFLIVWLIAQFIPSGRLAQIALAAWAICITLIVCGITLGST